MKKLLPFGALNILLCLFFLPVSAQINNWIGGISTDYFNKLNWSDTTINFSGLTSTTLRIGKGTPNNAVLNGGNSSNVNYRPARLNTLGDGVFTCNGAVYPNNNDSLNGTIILNAPADMNIRNIVYIGNRQAALVNINGGTLSSRNGMFIAVNTGGSAVVNVKGGSLNAGAGGANMDLSIANAAGLTGQVNITGGSVKVSRNLLIGTGGSIFVSGIGLLQVSGDKVSQLNGLVADGRLTCPAGKTLTITYDGTNTTAYLPQNPNSMLREFGDSIVLNNGIIRARIEKRSGDILSLKYNGIEQLNQIGASRTGAYHDFQTSYGFETMNNCVFTVKVDTTNLVDISLRRNYNPATGQVTPADADIHYVLNRGDTGLYSYSILEHKPEYPSFDLGSWRLVEWIAQDGTNYLCERIYVDSLRNWQMPSVYDFNNADATPIAEIVKLKTGVRSGKYDGKYEYTTAFWETPVWGHASSVNHIGTWVIMPNPEYVNGGPTHQDLVAAAGINHVLLNGLHYGDKGFVIPQGESFKKVYGPYLLYTSAGQTGDDNWAAAKRRAEKEQAKWPYSWLTNTPEYPLTAQRGSVSGKFVISDAAKPGYNGANAWVGLTQISNADNEWQHEGKNYHYWVKSDAAGNFTIANVRPGTYTLFAFTKGAVGEYSQANVVVSAGTDNRLGTLTRTIDRSNGTLLWQIGEADRTSKEFKLGQFDYCEGYVEQKFRDTFPSIITYNVAAGNYAQVWPFAHTKYPTETFAPGDSWKWRINFSLPAGTPLTGNARLSIAYASNDHAQQWIYVNNETTAFTTYFPDNGDGNAFIRQANYAKYSYKQVLIPMSRLRVGDNTITLVMPSNSLWVSHLMYDYLSLEAVTGSVLPLNLLTFNAKADGQKAALNWVANNHKAGDVFVIERSFDNRTFTNIGSVNAKVGSASFTYDFIDLSPAEGKNFYRLKKVDNDGSVTYSEMRVLSFTQRKLRLYPNPSAEYVQVTLPAASKTTITIVDVHGATVFNRVVTGVQATLNVSSLPAGTYLVKVWSNGVLTTEKLYKQ